LRTVAERNEFSSVRKRIALLRRSFCAREEIIAASPLREFLREFRLRMKIACGPEYLVQQVPGQTLSEGLPDRRLDRNPMLVPGKMTPDSGPDWNAVIWEGVPEAERSQGK
jgi:hypothetical protein